MSGQLRDILGLVASGRLSADDALRRMAHYPFEDLGFAKVDHHRGVRCGYPEVIFCAGKTPVQVVSIARSIRASGESLLATRADGKVAAALKRAFPRSLHNAAARTVVVPGKRRAAKLPGLVAVVCAGTSDLPVAEEARETAVFLGCTVRCYADVGVAGIHRLLVSAKELREATVVIVIAGMEGALPSVVGGLVDVPVIAVPTSVGYGTNLNGFAPLLTMLNSCASGVTVVNIDNGFGAAYNAALVCRAAARVAEAK